MPPAPATADQALQNYQQFAGSMQKPQDILQGQEQQLGVPQAQQQVSGLRQAITNTTNLLNNVPSSVMGRTENSLVTSAQANRQIGNEQAPIAQNLNKENQDYSGASSDLNTLLGRASNLAGLTEQGQQNQLSTLKGVYDALFGQEQAANAKQLEQQKLAEQQREFNAGNAGNNAYMDILKNSMGGNSAPAATGQMSQRQGGGFNFTGANGMPISAASYASANKIPIGQILYQMGQSGDAYAAKAYNDVQLHQDVMTPQGLQDYVKRTYPALFWGT